METRTYQGRVYSKYDVYPTRREAREAARYCRERGYRTYVYERAAGGWIVWYSNDTGHGMS